MNIEDKIIENLRESYTDIDVFFDNISEFDLVYLKEIKKMNYAKKILELEVKKLEKSLKEFEDANWERGMKLTKHKIKQVKKVLETIIKE